MLHHCTQPSISNFRFYDISGENARSPLLLHQFNGGSPSCPFSVWNISPVVRGGAPVTLFSGLHGYSTGALHSLSISNDGSRAYFALLEGGFAVVDESDFAAGRPSPQPRPITPDRDRPTWPGPGAHSAAERTGSMRPVGAASAHVVLGPQPDADAQDRVLHLAFAMCFEPVAGTGQRCD
jgi:hypothetical protein